MKKSFIRRTATYNGGALRFWIQAAFIALCLWIGIEFILWYGAHADGATPVVNRPPGVEGFLPISALMSLWYFAQTGDFNMIHPAGTVILAAIVLMSIAFKKSFCSWLCPVGTISESLADLGKKLFKRNFKPWVWIDLPLRSLKYLMLAFLAYSVFVLMTPADLRAFLESPYNRVADVKMLLFFRDITRTALIVIGVLMLGSLFIRGFWCRYLCPYGALLGLAGLLSPLRITRNPDTCIDCAKCAKVCPSRIKVDKVKRVWSDECTSCMSCVEACPVADALQLKAHRRSRFEFRTIHVAIGVVATFLLLTGGAMLAGAWHSSVSEEEFGRRIRDIDNPVYQHHYGSAPSEDPTPAAEAASDAGRP
jgi:polyferredoxin